MSGYRICPICEAACGLKIDTDGKSVVAIRSNEEDVFSGGHICAKGIALKDLHADEDRLRTPLLRRNGTLEPATWDEAWAFIAERLTHVKDTHGSGAIASYVGNPTAHNFALSQSFGQFAQAAQSPHVYTAASVDQQPKHLACELMFGNDMAIPVPDIERCDLLLMLGANPIVSNGSLWIVPDFRGKLRALQARGGALITVDPRRTETARLADQHVFVQPGTDAFLLAALINELTRRGRTWPVDWPTRGGAELIHALQQIPLARAAEATGVSEVNIAELAEKLDNAANPVVYGRVGTTLQAYGTLTSFLIEALNLLLGALDQPGGAMFPEQVFAGPTPTSTATRYNRYQSRVSGYPEVLGQLPVAALAEEIETPGPGQIRALVCFAGNPVVSNPDSTRLANALQTLDLLICVDIYHNETTKLADVVLPGGSPFEKGHYDNFLGSMGYKNAARYSSPLLPTDAPSEWDIGVTLAFTCQHGRTPTADDLAQLDDDIVAAAATTHIEDQHGPLHGRDLQELMSMITPGPAPERLLDLGIRAGRWGDHFGQQDGLTLQTLKDTPNGVDLGPLREERLAEIVNTEDRKLHLAPAAILQDIGRLKEQPVPNGFLLIGRRNAQTNNSWLNNLPSLTRGRDLGVLEVNSSDARAMDIREGDEVRVNNGDNEITASVTLSDDIAPGVVCLPHGLSDDADLRQSSRRRGPNYNRLADATFVDPVSATSALNGLPVEVARLH